MTNIETSTTIDEYCSYCHTKISGSKIYHGNYISCYKCYENTLKQPIAGINVPFECPKCGYRYDDQKNNNQENKENENQEKQNNQTSQTSQIT